MPSAVRRTRQRVTQALADGGSLSDQIARADGVLRDVLGADVSAWGTVDPATLLSTSCAVFGDFPPGDPLAGDEAARERRIFELEWEDRDPNTFYDMVRRNTPSAALRLTVGPDIRSVRRYRDLLQPLDVVDELRVTCSADGLVWSTAIFYRRFDRHPFSEREVELTAAVSEPLARAFRQAMVVAACDAPAVHEAPGAVVVDADGSVLTSSHAAEELLSGANERNVATTLRGLVARLDRSAVAVARISAGNGVLVLHASPAKGMDGAATVVVERPRAVELAPLIMSAFGFTRREREVIEHVLHGASRGATARRLGVSDDTVGQHLTSAYRKAGVGGHAELASLLFGRFYEAPRARHAPPSPYGHFLPER